MSEIKISLVWNFLEQPAIAEWPHAVPSHVGQFYIRRQLIDVPVKQAETGKLRRFGAALIERLQAQANSEKRRAAGNGGQKRLPEAAGIERMQQSGAVADAGKNQASSGGKVLGLIGDVDIRAEAAQGASDRSDVAGAIIDQSGDHSSSLVLGSTLRKRLSLETAKRRARAKALNTASTW